MIHIIAEPPNCNLTSAHHKPDHVHRHGDTKLKNLKLADRRRDHTHRHGVAELKF